MGGEGKADGERRNAEEGDGRQDEGRAQQR